MTLTITVALLAAVCFGWRPCCSTTARCGPARRSPLHPGLMVELARKRIWLIGVGSQVAGVALHLLAVNLGPLSWCSRCSRSGWWSRWCCSGWPGAR